MADRGVRLDPGQGGTAPGTSAPTPTSGPNNALGNLLTAIAEAQNEELARRQLFEEQGSLGAAAEDLGRLAIANTLGLIVPPLAERAMKGTTPYGALAAVPLAFWPNPKPKRVGPGLGPGVLDDVYRAVTHQPGQSAWHYSPAVGEGSFRRLHMGTRETALHRLQGRGVDPSYSVGEVGKFQLPVRGTLGTFEKPLGDPGADWIKDRAVRDALQKLNVDAILYRNTVEGPGGISLEVMGEARPVAVETFTDPGKVERALNEELLAPYQQLLPGIGQQSAPSWGSAQAVTNRTGRRVTMQPWEAAVELGLTHPRTGKPVKISQKTGRQLDSDTLWEWDDVWQATIKKSEGPEQMRLPHIYGETSLPPTLEQLKAEAQATSKGQGKLFPGIQEGGTIKAKAGEPEPITSDTTNEIMEQLGFGGTTKAKAGKPKASEFKETPFSALVKWEAETGGWVHASGKSDAELQELAWIIQKTKAGYLELDDLRTLGSGSLGEGLARILSGAPTIGSKGTPYDFATSAREWIQKLTFKGDAASEMNQFLRDNLIKRLTELPKEEAAIIPSYEVRALIVADATFYPPANPEMVAIHAKGPYGPEWREAVSKVDRYKPLLDKWNL